MSKEQMQLGKEALEKQLAYKDKASKTQFNKLKNTAYVTFYIGLMGLVCLGTIGDKETDKTKNIVKSISFGFYMFWLLVYVLVLPAKPSGFNKDHPDYAEYKERLEKLLQDENLRADIERELAKTAPMMQDMMRKISEEYPETGKKMLENNLSEQDSKLILEFMRAYMKTHQKDARQFVNVMSAAQMPQDLIDRFIAEYVSDTISFNMAQGLMDKQKD